MEITKEYLELTMQLNNIKLFKYIHDTYIFHYRYTPNSQTADIKFIDSVDCNYCEGEFCKIPRVGYLKAKPYNLINYGDTCKTCELPKRIKL